jgi:hypothetical protein
VPRQVQLQLQAVTQQNDVGLGEHQQRGRRGCEQSADDAQPVARRERDDEAGEEQRQPDPARILDERQCGGKQQRERDRANAIDLV